MSEVHVDPVPAGVEDKLAKVADMAGKLASFAAAHEADFEAVVKALESGSKLAVIMALIKLA